MELNRSALTRTLRTPAPTTLSILTTLPLNHNGIRMEGRWHLVRRVLLRTSLASTNNRNSYNRYLAIAARVVRRSLKEDKRLAAERRGEMDLRFAKWQVSWIRRYPVQGGWELTRWNTERQAGRDEEPGSGQRRCCTGRCRVIVGHAGE